MEELVMAAKLLSENRKYILYTPWSFRGPCLNDF